MGCGNALQVAKDECVHMRRENDEMRQNLTRLKRKAESSVVLLTAEQEKIAALTASLELAQQTLIAVGNTFGKGMKEWFAQDFKEISADSDIEQIAQQVMDAVLQFHQCAFLFCETSQKTASDLEEFVKEKRTEPSDVWDKSDVKGSLALLWDELQRENLLLKSENRSLSRQVEERQASVSMLSVQLAEKTQRVISLSQELSQLESELTSKGYVLAPVKSVSLSFVSENSIEEGSCLDESQRVDTGSSIE